jgi:hypothetical protein
MATRRTVGVVMAGLGFVLSSTLVSGGVAVARGTDPSAPRQVVTADKPITIPADI